MGHSVPKEDSPYPAPWHRRLESWGACTGATFDLNRSKDGNRNRQGPVPDAAGFCPGRRAIQPHGPRQGSGPACRPPAHRARAGHSARCGLDPIHRRRPARSRSLCAAARRRPTRTRPLERHLRRAGLDLRPLGRLSSGRSAPLPASLLLTLLRHAALTGAPVTVPSVNGFVETFPAARLTAPSLHCSKEDWPPAIAAVFPPLRPPPPASPNPCPCCPSSCSSRPASSLTRTAARLPLVPQREPRRRSTPGPGSPAAAHRVSWFQGNGRLLPRTRSFPTRSFPSALRTSRVQGREGL